MNNPQDGINPEIKELQTKLSAAEAAGAEMRAQLGIDPLMAGIGTGWKSPAEVALLEATLEQRTNEANLATETAKKLSENLWKWSRGLIGLNPYTPE